MVMLTVACASAFAQTRVQHVDSVEISKDRSEVTYIQNGKKVVLFRKKHVPMDYAAEQLKNGVVDTLVDAHGYRAAGKKEFYVINHKYYLQNGEVQVVEKRTMWQEKNTADMTFEDMKNVVDGSASAVDYNAKDLLHRNLSHFQVGLSAGANWMTKTNFVLPTTGLNIDIHSRRGFVFGVDAGMSFVHPYLEGTVGAKAKKVYQSPYFGGRVGWKFWLNRNKNSYISPSVMGRFSYTRSDIGTENGGATGTYAPSGGLMLESGFVLKDHFVLKANVWGTTGTNLPHNSSQDWKEVNVGASIGVAFLMHFKKH